jgi:hypothetical protein
MFSVRWELRGFFLNNNNNKVFDEHMFHMLKLCKVKTELHVGNEHFEVLENWPLS